MQRCVPVRHLQTNNLFANLQTHHPSEAAKLLQTKHAEMANIIQEVTDEDTQVLEWWQISKS